MKTLPVLSATLVAATLATSAMASKTSGGKAAAAPPLVTHVCLAPAAVQMLDNGAGAEGAVSAAFASYLQGPTLQATALESRLQAQIRQEAQQQDCGFVLFQTLKQERHTKGVLGRIAAGAFQSGMLQASSVAQTASARVVTGAAAGAASNLTDVVQVQNRDSLRLEYRLEDAAGAVVAQGGETVKATADGQDLLTPLIRNAAENIGRALVQPSTAPGAS